MILIELSMREAQIGLILNLLCLTRPAQGSIMSQGLQKCFSCSFGINEYWTATYSKHNMIVIMHCSLKTNVHCKQLIILPVQHSWSENSESSSPRTECCQNVTAHRTRTKISIYTIILNQLKKMGLTFTFLYIAVNMVLTHWVAALFPWRVKSSGVRPSKLIKYSSVHQGNWYIQVL